LIKPNIKTPKTAAKLDKKSINKRIVKY
jgi:hypothetical protein